MVQMSSLVVRLRSLPRLERLRGLGRLRFVVNAAGIVLPKDGAENLKAFQRLETIRMPLSSFKKAHF